ncbi:hypothetical protein BUALT_BualtUnG0059200 [Buddleja alternifolia]|uniref:DUF569 domain-containing protein n=1 Tax=Buddleja alternifolia TaxID=168488 RepID=A0AAV6W040_9LAMI|nr:hypothetical protein BUALT_BualtUnG0059200 [Buddleja alternifolia]
MASDGGATPTKASERLRRPSFFSQKRWPSIASDQKSSHNSGKEDGMERSSRMNENKVTIYGMEFFNKAKAVRLQSHLGKYLVADDDEETIRQSRNGASHKARWTVEYVDGKHDRIRLKSCHGLYLTAVDEPFVLIMTGKKVLQTLPEKKTDVAIEWEPIKEGFHVKLMTNDEKFLRANGGAPPWRNSVTHDVPHRTATQGWVLWGVEIVDISLSGQDPDPNEGCFSPASSFSSLDDYSGLPDTGSPMFQHSRKSNYSGLSETESPKFHHSRMSNDLGSPDTGSPMFRNSRKSNFSNSPDTGSPMYSRKSNCSGLSDTGLPVVKHSVKSGNVSTKKHSGMEFFRKAKSVRLKSRHDKYLTAHSDEEIVIQDRSGSSKSVKWTVEFVEDVENVVRLKSCYGKYLHASDEEFLLGVTGRKVAQALPRKLDSSVEWEPIRDGMQVKLKTRYGNFLRANGGLPPWRNSITYDIPHRHHDWILWEVDVVEIRPESPPPEVSRSESLEELN